MILRISSRQAILEAAFLALNENPGASLADVADRAGVGRATLHRHFSTRQDLMVALAETALDELDAAVEAATQAAQSHTEALQLSLAAVIPLAPRQWFLSHETFDAQGALRDRHAEGIAELHAAIEAARDEGSFAPDLPTKWIAEAYENLIYAAWTLVRDQDATPTQAADMAWRTFLKGVSQ